VYARRQFCGDLEVCRPPEPLWNPRLREAATTLAAMRRQRGGVQAFREESVIRKCCENSYREEITTQNRYFS